MIPMTKKLDRYAANCGHSSTRPCQRRPRSTSGTRSSRTSRGIAIAKTPSLNASSRAVSARASSPNEVTLAPYVAGPGGGTRSLGGDAGSSVNGHRREMGGLHVSTDEHERAGRTPQDALAGVVGDIAEALLEDDVDLIDVLDQLLVGCLGMVEIEAGAVVCEAQRGDRSPVR